MNVEKQKTEATYPQKDRAELEGYAGGQTFLWMTEKEYTETTNEHRGLLEYILNPTNITAAYKQVAANKGSGGVDSMQVAELLPYLTIHQDAIITSLQAGKYRPNPVKRVEIPKENGKVRTLGIPTVVDRVIQQAITQVLTPIYEEQFSPFSYGFRPKRSAHQAIKQSQTYAQAGYCYVVDMDLEKFFDEVSQSKLVEVLSKTIRDGRVVSLIHKYLRAGAVQNGVFEKTPKGVPQGGNLSPLLSNIMLNELDKELEKRGLRFVRYADDCMIFCKSQRAAERVLQSITRYIETKLYLKVNREKTVVAHLREVKFLGYGFYFNKDGCQLRTHAKSLSKMKAKIKSLTSGSNGVGNDKRKEQLRQFIVGWVNYFSLAKMKSHLQQIDEWYRRRLRMVIWKQWKRIRTKIANLIKLHIPKQKAYEYANTRKGYWRVASSPILSTSITNKRLQLAGYLFFTDHYLKITKSFNS